MFVFRAVLSTAMVVFGAAIIVRLLPYGLKGVPGLVLGAAMIGLGLYRLNQLRAVWSRR